MAQLPTTIVPGYVSLLRLTQGLDLAPLIVYADLLTRSSPLAALLHQTECNNGDTHKFGSIIKRPDALWFAYGQGLHPSQSQRAVSVGTTGMVGAELLIEEETLKAIASDKDAFLAAERVAFIESLGQEISEKTLYGNRQAENNFDGLANWYNTLDPTVSVAANNVIDGGGKSPQDNTSIYVIQTGPNSTFQIYPRGGSAGIEADRNDRLPGIGTNGGNIYSHQERFKRKVGLIVRDWRKVVRIANIDVNQAAKQDMLDSSGNPDPFYFRLKLNAALIRMPSFAALNIQETGSLGGQDATLIVMNRTTYSALMAEQIRSSQWRTEMSVFEGVKVQTFMGVPILVEDAVINTEQLVS